MNIIAHRGLSGRYPENTRIAFEEAAKLSIWGVEFDVHVTMDQELVVIHDESLHRTSNGKGFVKDFTLAELRHLDFGSWFAPQFTGQQILTLREVLHIFQSTTLQINIELKTDIFEYEGIEQLVADEIQALQLENRVWISSFNHETIARFKKINSNVKTALLFSSLITDLEEYVKKSNCDAIHIHYYHSLRKIIQQAIANGLIVRAYTVNDKTIAGQLAATGIKAIFTDHPGTFI
jgi:glycerophosphoryl diester phosphodiesterase